MSAANITTEYDSNPHHPGRLWRPPLPVEEGKFAYLSDFPLLNEEGQAARLGARSRGGEGLSHSSRTVKLGNRGGTTIMNRREFVWTAASAASLLRIPSALGSAAKY